MTGAALFIERRPFSWGTYRQPPWWRRRRAEDGTETACRCNRIPSAPGAALSREDRPPAAYGESGGPVWRTRAPDATRGRERRAVDRRRGASLLSYPTVALIRRDCLREDGQPFASTDGANGISARRASRWSRAPRSAPTTRGDRIFRTVSAIAAGSGQMPCSTTLGMRCVSFLSALAAARAENPKPLPDTRSASPSPPFSHSGCGDPSLGSTTYGAAAVQIAPSLVQARPSLPVGIVALSCAPLDIIVPPFNRDSSTRKSNGRGVRGTTGSTLIGAQNHARGSGPWRQPPPKPASGGTSMVPVPAESLGEAVRSKGIRRS
jgi:hypothetical protein